MGMDVKTIVGIFLLLGFIQVSLSQSCNRNCTACSGGTCLNCDDGYTQSQDGSGCCSKGCNLDANSYHACNINTGECSYTGCLSGYFGPTCEPCPLRVRNCDICALVFGNESIVHCTQCAPSFFVTTDKRNCCPEFCDSCEGPNGQTCTSCKSEYYLYNDRCDSCGDYCLPPADNTARCDALSGTCLYGCLNNWHGSKCDEECTVRRCDVCTYDEPTKNLTCADCIDGFQGPYCLPCYDRCLPSPVSGSDPNICFQDGTCRYGCDNGYRGDKCDRLCEEANGLQNCAVCDRYQFSCTECKDGYWGDTCQFECSDTCVRRSDRPTCSISQGSCDFGCIGGYYLHDCTGECPNCGRDTCNRTSGECLSAVCDPGFYGVSCNLNCPTNCAPDPLNGMQFCDFSTGGCTYGCIDGKFGTYCTQGCSVNCASSPSGLETGPLCSQTDGACDYQCRAGYYRNNCTSSCKSQCVDNTCDLTQGTCLECAKDEPGFLCPFGTCSPGLYGQECQVTCVANCELTCGRYDGICTACDAGYHGNMCNQPCGQCTSGTCVQQSGLCTTECNKGYWGSYCNQTCNYEGCDTCLQQNGECTTCKIGLFGQRCSQSCSQFCSSNVFNQITCEKNSGACDEGSCSPGYWSSDCLLACNQNCLLDTLGARVCYFENGECTLGCENTYYGARCDSRCSNRCVNQLCNRDGSCSLGCINGAYGDKCQYACQETCNNDQCGRDSGICDECNKPSEIQTPLCRTAACQPFNTWGQFCENECPVNCGDGTCSRDNGVCSKCKDGYHGDFCDQECPNCVGNKCYQIDGACIDGCLDGWYTLTCMSRCLHSGCFKCERNDGQCLSCLTSLFGTNCSRDCSRTCTANTNGQITCNRFSGECDTSLCRAGYYTPQCTAQCSTYCANTVCDIETGTCEPCSLGWYGQKCDGQCSDRCKNKDCIVSKDNCRQGCTDGYWGSRCESFCNSNCDRQSCNKNTAECIYGCTGSLFFGPTCSEPCNGNCVNGMCNRTGFCEAGCKVGWYGEQCKFQCDAISRCTDGSCDRLTGLCNACFDEVPDDRCPTAECPSGRRGTSCNDLCTSENCLYNTCGRYDDKCKGCPNGYYGNLCAKTCPNCKEGTGCEQDSGICLQGCKDGWYTETCTTQCSQVCGSCERSSGECVTCAAGRWGNNCEQICSSNCAATQGISSEQLIFCDKQTGACSKKACKVGFWRQDCTQVCSSNCLPDDNNNRVCAYLDGECSNGCKDTFFGKVCDQLCSVRCRDQLCTGFANSCDISCADGYYGGTCSGTCSTHCAGNGKCDPSTGQCFEGCELGYYGPRCDDPCKNTCVDSTCDSDGGCPDCKLAVVGPNCRVQVCTPGFYGPTCETSCPGQYCYENRCQRNSGICENGCLDNYYGAYCTEICQCDKVGTDECEQSRGTCICKPGRFGTLCDQTCNDGCFALECERDGKCSSGCNAGRYGALCDKTCENCFNQDCGASTGTCLQGCKEGWYGPQCNNRCDEKCRACHFETGACSSCADRYYGFPACEAVCSNNCLQESSGRTCSQTTGECFNGCKSGYFGERCTNSCGRCASGETCDARSGICMACADGWWGDTCKNECNARCATSSGRENGRCRQSDGNCNYGCVPGFYSDDCDLSCESTYCTDSKCDRNSGLCLDDCEKYHWGVNCEHSCSECKNGECDQSSGYCTAGCLPGRYGDKCENTCLSLCRDNTCESSGYCLDCQLSPKGSRCLEIDPTTLKPPVETVVPALSLGEIIGISVGCVVFVIIFVIVFVCCMNYKRRYDDAKTEIHLPSDVLERLSTHRSLHSTVSTNYPVARVVGDEEKDFVLF